MLKFTTHPPLVAYIRCEQKAPQRPDPCRVRLCERVTWDTQAKTFVASLTAQTLTLIFSFVALGFGHDPPEALETILVLETVVQLVELAWYSVVAIYVCRNPGSFDIPVHSRYIDWVITTPTMLISLYFFLVYQGELKKDKSCVSNHDLSQSNDFSVRLVVIVLADWLMLAPGFYHEKSARRRRKIGWEGVDNEEQWPWQVCGVPIALFAGFVFLLVAFVPHSLALYEEYSHEGLALLLGTFFVWAIYGVVAVRFDSKTEAGQQAKNSCYNILDIFSKNVFGLVISAIALSHGGSC